MLLYTHVLDGKNTNRQFHECRFAITTILTSWTQNSRGAAALLAPLQATALTVQVLETRSCAKLFL